MLRAAAWTGGLFAVGAGVVQWIPGGGAWVEPVVLVALGVGLLLAGGRRSAGAAGVRDSRAATGATPAERAAQ
jgi:hypothetical protein